jgi:hypothetical protein
MSTIADTITQRLQGPQLEQLGRQIGADPATTEHAVQTAVPLLLGGLARNSAQPEGSAALGRALQNHDGSLLDNLGGLLSNPASGKGAGILGHIFGGKRDTVEQGVGQATGLNGQQVGKLLMILAPIVMAALARKQGQTRTADAPQADAGGGLGDVLKRESEEAAQRAPGGLGGLMGMLDRDGDGNPLNDLGKLGGMFGGGR